MSLFLIALTVLVLIAKSIWNIRISRARDVELKAQGLRRIIVGKGTLIAAEYVTSIGENHDPK